MIERINKSAMIKQGVTCNIMSIQYKLMTAIRYELQVTVRHY